MRSEAAFGPGHARCEGAALVVCLTLVSAVSLLGAAAMRTLSLDTIVTGNVIVYAHARLATLSGVHSAIGEAAFPAAGELTLEYQFGPGEEFTTTVVIRHLGQALRSSANQQTNSNRPAEHFEILATALGPRSIRHTRRLYWFTLVSEEL